MGQSTKIIPGINAPFDETIEINRLKISEGKRYYLTPKYTLWEKYFFDKSNKETFGNATKSACAAYDLDPTDEKAYNVAGRIGYENAKKCKNLRKRLFDRMGVNHLKIYNLYVDIIEKKQDLNVLHSLAEDLEVELPNYRQIITAGKVLAFQQQNTQINANDVQIAFSSTEGNDRH